MLKQLDLFGAKSADQENKTGKSPIEIPEEAPIQTTDEIIQQNKVEESLPSPIIMEAVTEQETFTQKQANSPEKSARQQTDKKNKRGRKSLKDMETEGDMIEIPEDEILFSRQYYAIGEVAEMFNVNTSLVRYWETEFDILNPRKNRKGDRLFRPEDIKNLHLIYHLLRQRKYTIEGAKDFLKKNQSKAQQNFELIKRLQKVKAFLLEIKAGL